MKFSETSLIGAYLVDIEPIEDARGFFARAWCQKEFEAHGLNSRLSQINLSLTTSAGTIRGLHFQREPHAEAKLVRCISGSVFDVVVDVRPDSPNYLKWIAQKLTADNHRMLYIPEGFAHGYQTLEDDTKLLYSVSECYSPGSEDGFRFDDPAIGINWPLPVASITDKDASWPLVAPD
jgi:dTDP-4-dehydrorhamnose 3,5-epimerase